MATVSDMVVKRSETNSNVELATAAAGGSRVEMLFYDGTCGLCHRIVRFVLARDRAGIFRFAPLGGETFRALVPAPSREGLPDSVVVRTKDGRLLTKSAAVLYIMRRLGGVWRLLGAVARVIPSPVRDYFYDRVAGVRSRLFAKPDRACPLVPKELRSRFDS